MRAVVLPTIWVLLLASSAGAEELDCLIQPKTTVELSTPVEGVIDEVLVERGDVVVREQVLVRLQSSVERASVDLAQAQVEETGDLVRSRVQLEYAARTLERRAELNRENIISEQEMDEARSQHELAKAGVRQAEEARRLARLQLERAKASLGLRTIHSPIDGVVTKRFYEPGEFADTRAILELAQVDPLEVEVFASVSLLGRVWPGMAALVLPEEPFGGSYEASVTAVDPVIDAASGTFGVRLELPNPDLAIPAGLNCRLQFLEKVASADEPSALEARVELELAQTVVSGPARTRAVAQTSAIDGDTNAVCETPAGVSAQESCVVEPVERLAVVTEPELPQVAAPPPVLEPGPEQPPVLEVAAVEPPLAPAPPAGAIGRAVFTTAIERYEPVDEIEVLANDQREARFFTEIRDLDGRTITHRWEYQGRVQAEVHFQVQGPRWRVYSLKKLQPVWLGEWTVHVVDERGNVLHTATMDYVAAAPETPPEADGPQAP